MAYRLKSRRGLGMALSPTVQSALQNASQQSGVPYSLLRAVANRESSYNPAAVGSAGEQGLMQIMPANFSSLGLSNPFDPNANAQAGAKMLAQLYQQYGDWNTALIAYNEGPGNLAKSGIFPASQTYADSILQDAGLTDSSAGAGMPAGSPPIDPGGSYGSDSGLSGASWGAIGLVGAGLLLFAMR